MLKEIKAIDACIFLENLTRLSEMEWNFHPVEALYSTPFLEEDKNFGYNVGGYPLYWPTKKPSDTYINESKEMIESFLKLIKQ
ncbi:MAG: hypothetical protein PF542_05500 [Nanoarchaeota archaeon]|jgi:hypothetical protein|nr:hypothetical protein [Nanoarchaeota archaeon]